MIEDYFVGEKIGAVLLLLFGVLSILASVFFILKVKRPFEHGMSIPLLSFALFQLVVGSVVFNQSSLRFDQVTSFVETSQGSISSEEIPRVEARIEQLEWLKIVEIGIFIVGLVGLLLFWKQPFKKGVGAGLMAEAILLFCVSYFALLRAETYLMELQKWVSG